jgi:hypothetical protein
MNKKVETCPVCGVGETICHADWCTIQGIYVFGEEYWWRWGESHRMDLFWLENSNLFDK